MPISVFKKIIAAFSLSAHAKESAPAEQLYRQVLEHSRMPQLYRSFDVSDTLDGRFDMLCLHIACVMHRLKSAQHGGAAEFSQQLFDIFFADMDLSLREMGVGDLGVARRVRQMSEAYMGRLTAYGQAIDKADKPQLADALARNLGRRPVAGPADNACADYVMRARQRLDDISDSQLVGGGDVTGCFILN